MFKKTKKGIILAATYSPLASTIGANGLDFRVRDGIGYTPTAKATKIMPFFLTILIIGRPITLVINL